jgi:hypothetical protein
LRSNGVKKKKKTSTSHRRSCRRERKEIQKRDGSAQAQNSLRETHWVGEVKGGGKEE